MWGPSIQHVKGFVRHTALVLLEALLARAASVLRAAHQWHSTHPHDSDAIAALVTALQSAIIKRVPGIETFFALRHACDAQANFGFVSCSPDPILIPKFFILVSYLP